ncbi:hypothetical protein, partial [Mesorhizobium sp. M8A.F.Ca.ET.202.01.1.1]|uniref:hypothetical protein n=1 Tax=Mesorhizobium sp. M8A.F.Ca.ET.202.01.1.1 TaxID=2563967 RepID=UPI001AED9CDB
ENLSDSTRIAARQLDEGPIHRHHHGQRPEAAQKQAEHMNEPDRFSIAIVRIFLLNGGRPHMNHKTA